MTGQELIFTENVPTLTPWPTRLSTSLRTKFFLTAVLCPLCCSIFVGFGGTPTIGDSWQNGHLATYIALILSSPTFFIFGPMIAFSMISIGLWCLRPNCYRNYWIRLGIYTGVALTLQFNFLLWVPTFFLSPMFGAIFIAVQATVFWLVSLIWKRIYRFTILHLLIITTVAAILFGAAMQMESLRVLLAIPSFVVLSALAGAPFMAGITFFRVAYTVSFLHRTNGLQTKFPSPPFGREYYGVMSAWLIGWIATWKFAIDSMLNEYSKLPASPPPGCFISAAAAHGHSRFVRARRNRSGCLVSMQMARCKMLELVLQATFPATHRRIRQVYNFVGPKIANLCRQSIWSADLAFLLMLPAEILAIVVQRIAGISNIKVRALYKMQDDEALDQINPRC